VIVPGFKVVLIKIKGYGIKPDEQEK